jgi:hypothetical protein
MSAIILNIDPQTKAVTSPTGDVPCLEKFGNNLLVIVCFTVAGTSPEKYIPVTNIQSCGMTIKSVDTGEIVTQSDSYLIPCPRKAPLEFNSPLDKYLLLHIPLNSQVLRSFIDDNVSATSAATATLIADILWIMTNPYRTFVGPLNIKTTSQNFQVLVAENIN